SDAIRLYDSDPDKAIYGFRQALKADPYNANAHAWLAAELYNQGRIPGLQQELREAHRLGLVMQMMKNARFRQAFNKARFNRQLPGELAE
ncbi:MAG: hypothetical protein KGI56_00710, partial [Acidobacteriota bacterium]|nr:hypothetical protein [Acidobacteriota bacterium]